MTCSPFCIETSQSLSKEKREKKNLLIYSWVNQPQILQRIQVTPIILARVIQQPILRSLIVSQAHYIFTTVTPKGGITGIKFYFAGSKGPTHHWTEGRRGTQHPQLPYSPTQCPPGGVVGGRSDRAVKNVSN